MSAATQHPETSTTPGTLRDESAPRYAPVCFARIPDEVLCGLPLFVRSLDANGTETFSAYTVPGTLFTADHRRRLYDRETTFLYIPAEEQKTLRLRLEEQVEAVAADRNLDAAARCEIVYETAFELLDETYTTGDLRAALPRLRRVARAIVTMHLAGPPMFTHFFSASRHDACPATHAANAAAWFPALARALGEFDLAALRAQCLGALIYDIGMPRLPPAIRNNHGKVSAEERQTMRRHPETGAQLLREVPGMEPIVPLIALQHHERMDGSGYPRGLTFDRIHHAARMIAVIDTYDTLTSSHPLGNAGMGPDAAVAQLRREAAHKYDAPIVEAWARVLREACPEISGLEPVEDPSEARGISRRRHARHAVKCGATLERVELLKGAWVARETLEAVAHNLSRGGVGFLCRRKLSPGQFFRVKLRKKDGRVEDLAVIVVRGRDYADGWFEAGTRFVDLAREATPQPHGECVGVA